MLPARRNDAVKIGGPRGLLPGPREKPQDAKAVRSVDTHVGPGTEGRSESDTFAQNKINTVQVADRSPACYLASQSMSESDEKRTWPISARLKQARAAAQPKLSQTELARRVQEGGLSYFQNGKASRLESGYAYATWAEVEAIARVLKVEPYWLANREKTVAVPKPEGMAKAATANTAVAPAPAPAPAAPPPVPSAVNAPAVSAPVTAVTSAPAPAPAPKPVAPPAGLASVASLLAPPPPPPPPPVDLPPLPLPPRGTLSVLDYRSLLGSERRKAEAAMVQKGLPAAEWRRWRDYSRAINDTLRSLN